MSRSLADLMAVPPGEVMIVTDYDGTIAPIVADPPRARPLPEAVEQLSALVPLVRRVAVLSGRTETSLRGLLTLPGADLIGENGIQALTPEEHESLRALRLRAVAAVARWPGVVVESKPASLSIHFRSQPEVAAELEKVLADLVAGSGLMMVANRMVFDVQSRHGSKVLTMCRLIEEVQPSAVMYAGDSRDDARVHRFLKTAPLETLCVGIASDEVPPDLFKNADLVVDGPPDMATLLSTLARHWSGQPVAN